MSITGISAASSADSILQWQAATPVATVPGIVLTPAAKRTAPVQQSGQAPHKTYHRGGGEGSEASLEAAATAPNILSALS
jgi:hypothetical protein